jgi:tetratricopeptide (TPR) repeat protein
MMMRNILLFIVLLIIGACSTGTQVSKSKISGEDLLRAGNYSAALNYYETQIAKAKESRKIIAGNTYCCAGKAAFCLNDNKKALKYFEEATVVKYADIDMYVSLLKLYKDIDNLSREIDILESIIANYPNYEHLSSIQTRLLVTCLESENWELAHNLWKELDGKNSSDVELLDAYFKINISIKDEEQSNFLAKRLNKIDANNMTALLYLGKQSFWKAENRYQKETKAYEKKKTRRQYAKLLKALDTVTNDFKRSLKYFDKLYKLEPQKKHAKFLGNIYARLNNKEKSIYYKNRAR